jgi:hypothetical protein
VKTRYIEIERRPRKRHYKGCGCRRNVSPIVDTAHTGFMRWTLTALAVLALAASMGWPFLITGGLAVVAWKHR